MTAVNLQAAELLVEAAAPLRYNSLAPGQKDGASIVCLEPFMSGDLDVPESDLITRATEGDHTAFRELVRRYESTVAGTVFGMLGRCEEAEDIGQETMVRLYRSLDRFRGEASLKTYVTRIAINLCVDALRRRKRRAWQFWRSDDDDEMDIADPQDTHENAERRQGIERALNSLTPEFRSVVVMRLVQGFSTEEVAGMLQIPAGTVLSRLARAKKQLTVELEGYINV